MASEKAASLAESGQFGELCPARLSTPCDGRVLLEIEIDGERRKAIGKCPLHGTSRCPRHQFEADCRRRKILEAIGFPRRYWDPDPGRFSPLIADRLRHICARLPQLIEEGVGILVVGPVGSGKTHLLSYLAWQAVESGLHWEQVQYWRSDRLLRYLREHPDDYMRAAALVLIDDFDAVDLSGYNAELLDGFVEQRYGWKLSLCVACNSAAVAELPTMQRMVDRWREMMVTITLNRESQRRELTWEDVFAMTPGGEDKPAVEARALMQSPGGREKC